MMKPLKTVGIVVLFLSALAAAYYSYSQTYGYRPPSASGGPPPGVQAPRMPGGPGKTARPQPSGPPGAGAAEHSSTHSKR